jgi:hypothetical protein
VVHCLTVHLLLLPLKQRTGGWLNEGVSPCLIRSVEDVCGDEFKGGGAVVCFCSEPRGTCEIQSHTRSKANLQQNCLCPCVPKKGANQVRLEPSLLLRCLPPDKTIDKLML